MRATLLASSVCLFVFVNAGCTTPMRPGVVSFFQPPSPQAVVDPAMESGTYQKFTVVPSGKEAAELGMHPLVEKQLLFMVRNELECLGYQYVENPDQSDFFVRLTYSNEHSRGATEATKATTTFHDSGGGFGVARSRGTATKYGSYCPTLKVAAFGTDSKEEIWSGSILAETPNPEIRLSANHLLPMLLADHFPLARHIGDTVDSKGGIFGCDLRIVTPSGNDCFPVVTGILLPSPAKPKLRLYDLITEIDGNSTKNRSYFEIRAALDKDPGEQVSLTLVRYEKTRKTTIVAAEEAEVRYFDLSAADYATGVVRNVSLSHAKAQYRTLSKERLLNLLP